MGLPVKAFLTQYIPKQQDWKIKLLNNWEQIIGNLSQHVTIIKVLEDTIVLGVYDAAWMQELYMLRGNEGLFKNFAARVAPLPARDVNLNLSNVPAPEADSPEGQAALEWFKRLRNEEGRELQ